MPLLVFWPRAGAFGAGAILVLWAQLVWCELYDRKNAKKIKERKEKKRKKKGDREASSLCISVRITSTQKKKKKKHAVVKRNAKSWYRTASAYVGKHIETHTHTHTHTHINK